MTNMCVQTVICQRQDAIEKIMALDEVMQGELMVLISRWAFFPLCFNFFSSVTVFLGVEQWSGAVYCRAGTRKE